MSLRVIIIEDKDEDLRDVSNYLADSEICEPEDVHGAGTYDAAIRIITERALDTDVVFLDLNIPRNDEPGTSEKGHGRRVLECIRDLNERALVRIKVIVVSAESLDDSWDKNPLLVEFRGTLVDFVNKDRLAEDLCVAIRKLDDDPLHDHMLRINVGVEGHYNKTTDPKVPIRERLEEACALATRLLRNDMDFTYKNTHASDAYADDLNGLIWKLKQDRFAADHNGKHFIKESGIQTPDGWKGFLWRGCLEQHLYTLLRYRNDYVHIRSKPFRTSGVKDDWQISENLLESMEKGELLGQVVELIVRDLLQWYLPWHEQVFLPWKTTRGTSS